MAKINTDYADAMCQLEDEIGSMLIRAEERGLSKKEVADELRRIADQVEKEG